MVAIKITESGPDASALHCTASARETDPDVLVVSMKLGVRPVTPTGMNVYAAVVSNGERNRS
jgi:hypothetical protein